MTSARVARFAQSANLLIGTGQEGKGKIMPKGNVKILSMFADCYVSIGCKKKESII